MTTRTLAAVRRFAAGAIAAAVAFAGFGLVAAVPAQALTCIEPSPSPYAFTGTVVETEWDGRIAVVRADGGATVEVRGAVADDPAVTTMEDRTFTVGARYEFHPRNSESPFQDGVCTMTRLVDASAPTVVHPGVVDTEPTGATGATGATGGQPGQDDDSSAIPGWLTVLGLAAVVGAVSVLVVARARRRRSGAARKLP